MPYQIRFCVTHTFFLLRVSKIFFLEPTKENQYFNLRKFKDLLTYKNNQNKPYALCEPKTFVSYFEIYYNFVGWQPYDESDPYREMYEIRNTNPLYYIYIEAFDDNCVQGTERL